MPQSETTYLSPQEEQRFQRWIQTNRIPDLDHPDSHYDYRGFWKEKGDVPVKFGVDHFPDTYKQHGHPTFSIESKYSKGEGGHWEGEKFVPQKKQDPYEGLDIQPIQEDTTSPRIPESQLDDPLSRGAFVAGEDIKRYGKGLGKLALGAVQSMYTPYATAGIQAGMSLAEQIAQGENPYVAGGTAAAEAVGIPVRGIRQLFTDPHAEEAAEQIGEITGGVGLLAAGAHGMMRGRGAPRETGLQRYEPPPYRPEIRDITPKPTRPGQKLLTDRKLRLNEDGTFTDLETGEVTDKVGKPIESPYQGLDVQPDTSDFLGSQDIRPEFKGSKRNKGLGREFFTEEEGSVGPLDPERIQAVKEALERIKLGVPRQEDFALVATSKGGTIPKKQGVAQFKEPPSPQRTADYNESNRITNETDPIKASENWFYWRNRIRILRSKGLDDEATLAEEMASTAKQRFNELHKTPLQQLQDIDPNIRQDQPEAPLPETPYPPTTFAEYQAEQKKPTVSQQITGEAPPETIHSLTDYRAELQKEANRGNVSYSAEGIHPESHIPVTHNQQYGGYQSHRRGDQIFVTHPDYNAPIGPFLDEQDAGDWIMYDQDRMDLGHRKDYPTTPPVNPSRLAPVTREPGKVLPFGSTTEEAPTTMGPERANEILTPQKPGEVSLTIKPEPEFEGPQEHRVPNDQMYGPSEFHQRMGSISRMSSETAARLVEKYNELIDHAQTNYPDKINTIRQLTEVRDAAQSRAEGTTPSMWGTKGEHPYEVKIQEPPQEMRVPGINPQTGRENIAMGGASPQVIKTMGTTLYSGDRPAVVIKEGIQNISDEHKLAGVTSDIRVLFLNKDKHPVTGAEAVSITMRDRGRGLSEEDLYTVFTNLGESGKRGANAQVSAGGFGFAKAAPMQAGTYVEASSIVQEGKRRVKYTFAGSPSELRNQALGVPLVKSLVMPPNTPTGVILKTYFKENSTLMYARRYLDNVTKHSQGFASDIEMVETSLPNDHIMNKWINWQPVHSGPPLYEYLSTPTKYAKSTAPPPPLKGHIETAGASIDIYYRDAPGNETANYNLHVLNKGLYQTGGNTGYGAGGALPNVPSDIYVDVAAKVEPGEEGYPYTVNREQLDSVVMQDIEKWIHDNIAKAELNARSARMLEAWNVGMKPFAYTRRGAIHYYDQGERFTQSELEQLILSPVLQKGMESLQKAYYELVKIADGLGWPGHWSMRNWVKPSTRLVKFGLLFAAPDPRPGKGTVLGIHVPNPAKIDESAILVNLFEILARAHSVMRTTPINELGTAIFTTLAHEIAHSPGGPHDDGFAYRDAELREKLGTIDTTMMQDELAASFGDLSNGRLNQEILDLLQLYQQSRGRPESVEDTLLGTGVNIERPTDTGRRERNDVESIPRNRGGIAERAKEFLGSEEGSSTAKVTQDINAFAKAMLTSYDFSAPGRQAAPLMLTKAFWTSLDDMFKAWGSQRSYDAIMDGIENDPSGLFKRRPHPILQGKFLPSYADIVGLDLTDVFTKREERFGSKLAEMIPGVKRSERAYVAYLNKVRADHFKQMYKTARRLGIDPKADLTYGRAMANFINTATGRGSLGRFQDHANTLNAVFFAPKFYASRLRMLDPRFYVQQPKGIRMQALKAGFALAGAAIIFNKLYEFLGAEVKGLEGTNPWEWIEQAAEPDFGKSVFGETRVDPGAGELQYITLAAKLARDFNDMYIEGNQENYGKFGQNSPFDYSVNFLTGKMNPVQSFLVAMGKGTDFDHEPFEFKKALLNRTAPIMIQDIMKLNEEDPNLIPLAIPSAFGQSVQTYGR